MYIAPKKNDNVTVYYLPWCHYCKAALQLLQFHNIKHVAHDISSYNRQELDKLASNSKAHPTVPKIFHKNKFIGGFRELLDYIKTLNNSKSKTQVSSKSISRVKK